MLYVCWVDDWLVVLWRGIGFATQYAICNVHDKLHLLALCAQYLCPCLAAQNKFCSALLAAMGICRASPRPTPSQRAPEGKA